MRITFKQLQVVAQHKWVDGEGKRRQKTKRFTMTLNPYNRNPDGTVRTEREILAALNAQKAAWFEEMRGIK
jgi:hypothetical protein